VLPAALEVGAGARREQLERVGHACPLGRRDGTGRGFLLCLLVLLPQRDIQLALTAEVVVQAANA
jgi:hypothetical protein